MTADSPTVRHAPVATGHGTAFVGTGHAAAARAARDRVIATVWILLFVLMAASSASATQGLYPTLESRVRAANAINDTPATLALYGRVFDPTSLGAVSTAQARRASAPRSSR